MSHKYVYTKDYHFRHRLQCYAGAENKQIPDHVFAKIQEHMVERHITPQHLNRESLRQILKENNLFRYHENIPSILCKLTGKTPIDLQNYRLSPSRRIFPASLATKSISVPADTQCCICLEDILGDIDAVQTECSHYFHTQCIYTWQKQKNNCPFCRRELLIAAIVEDAHKTSGLVNMETKIMDRFKEWRERWDQNNTPKRNMPRFDYLIERFWQEIVDEHLKNN